MKLMIIEPHASGHHMALYARWLVKVAVDRGWQLHLLTTKSAIEHPAFKCVLKECSNIEISFISEVHRTISGNWIKLLIDQWKYYQSIKKGFHNIKHTVNPDLIYMINIDHFDKILAILGSPFGKYEFSGMMMNIKFHRKIMSIGATSRSDWLYKKLLLNVLKIQKLKKLTIIDEPFYEYSEKYMQKHFNKISLIPDVGDIYGSESQDEARNNLRIQKDKFVILVYGVLTKKKGIKQLLRSVIEFNSSKLTVLLAGIQDEDIKDLMQKPEAIQLKKNGQLVESSGFHNEVCEYRVFKAANAVWIGYIGQSFGSSGVLYQSCSIGLPVLATSKGLVGWIVKRYNIGFTFDPEDKYDVSKNIGILYSDSKSVKIASDNAILLSKKHTGLIFGKYICDAIK